MQLTGTGPAWTFMRPFTHSETTSARGLGPLLPSAPKPGPTRGSSRRPSMAALQLCERKVAIVCPCISQRALRRQQSTPAEQRLQAMGDRGGFDRGFGGRGDRGRGDRGDRGRGRGRGRPRGRKDEEEKWVPCTKLGRLVQQARYATHCMMPLASCLSHGRSKVYAALPVAEHSKHWRNRSAFK